MASTSKSQTMPNVAANLVHKAFDLVHFVDKLPVSFAIECLTCYNNIFILGTSIGRMLVYEVKITNGPPQKLESSFEKSVSVTKKSIQQLEAIKAFEILIALFDAQIHVFDLSSLQLLYSIPKTKNSVLFTTSMSSDQKLLRLCVSCKKKLQFFYMNMNTKSNNRFMDLVSDLELTDTPRALQFTKDNLLVFALRKEYYYYELPATSADVSNKQPEPRFSISSRTLEPLCEKLHNEFFTLGVEENKTIIYDTKGKPYLEYPILWSSSPSAVCSVGFYLIGILPSTNSVEIVTIQPSSTSVQMIDFSKDSVASSSSNPMTANTSYGSLGSSLGSSLSTISSTLTSTLTSSIVPSSVSSNTNSSDRLRILKSNGNSICYIATQTNVWCLTPIKVNEQLEQVVLSKHYDLGLKLASSQTDFNNISACPFAKSWQSLMSLSTSLPESYFNEKSGLLSPFFSLKPLINEVDESLYRRIKNLNALNLFARKQFQKSFQLFQEMKTDPSHLIAFLPGLLPDAYRTKLNLDDYFPKLDSKEQEEAISALIDYLQFKRNEFLKEGKTALNDQSFTLIPLIDGRPVFKTRTQILEIIDTTLLKCYLKLKDNLVPFFLRRDPNFLHLEESERLLIQHDKLSELIILYEKKETHEKALTLLVNESKKPSSNLFGLKHLVEYLKKLGNKHLQLIFKYAKNVIEQEPLLGMRIFTSGNAIKIDEILMRKIHDKENKSTASSANRPNGLNTKTITLSNANNKSNSTMQKGKQQMLASKHLLKDELDNDEFEEDDDSTKTLNHEMVAKFLNETIEPKDLSANLVRIYLQYCIYIWDERKTSLNNLLIDIYRAFIENNYVNTLQLSNMTLMSLKTYKQMLIYFLTETNNYEPLFALSKLDFENYAEERAIVLGRMGKHHEALNIYVNILNDTEKAEAYCANIFSKENILDSKQVYNQLLQIYLNSDYEEIRIGASIRLLNAHSAEIGSSKTLELLPAELMKCKNLSQFFENMLYRQVRSKHDMQIKTHLMVALQLQIHQTKIELQNKRFTLNEEQICKECNKRIGKSAIVRHPNGTLIHYGCLKSS